MEGNQLEQLDYPSLRFGHPPRVYQLGIVTPLLRAFSATGAISEVSNSTTAWLTVEADVQTVGLKDTSGVAEGLWVAASLSLMCTILFMSMWRLILSYQAAPSGEDGHCWLCVTGCCWWGIVLPVFYFLWHTGSEIPQL